MEKKTSLGRILTMGLLGASLAVVLIIPSASAKSANAANPHRSANKNAVTQEKALQKGKLPGFIKNLTPGGEDNGVRRGQEEMKPMFDFRDVTVTVVYLDNGIKETFITQEKSVIAQMKQFVARINKVDAAKDLKKGDDVKINVVAEATDTGMVITTTSTDADIAARIINHARIRELEKKLIEAKVDIKAAITRTVTETEKGVIITLSSDNADVAALIKLREKYPMPELRPGPGHDLKPGMRQGNKPNLPPGQKMKNKLGNQELPAEGPTL